MKALTQSVLAAAMLLALPFAAAEACTKNAWNGNTGAAAGAVASGPELPAGDPNKFARYSGKCSLAATTGQFVTDDTPNAEGTYQARLYVYTGNGVGKFFSATADNGGAGAERVGISFNGSAFSFSGPSGVATVPGVANRWYVINFTHQTGAAFSASIRGNAATTATTVTGTSATGTIGSASLGFIGAGTGRFLTDEFESSRSATTPIAQKCRGNANGTDTIISLADRIAISNEINGAVTGTGVAVGQPDFNEDGIVSLADRTLVSNVITSNQGATFCGGLN